MNRYDYFSGEPITGSPSFSSVAGISTDMQTVMGSTPQQQPTQYNYDPNMRSMQMNPSQTQYFNPGGYGYNTGYPGQMFPMNPPMGNTNMGFQGFQGNPALAMINNMNNGQGFSPFSGGFYNPYQMQQPVYYDKVVHVPGFNTGTEVLFPANIEEICDQLQIEMMIEQEEAIAERNKRFQGYFNNNFGTNYYGMPFTSNYMDQGILNKYRAKIEALKQEAMERRTRLNKGLSKLAHNYLGDEVTDEDIDRIYDGYSYTIPANTLRIQADVDRFSRMQPVSNQHIYAKHFNDMQRMYTQMVGENPNMNEFLQNQGIVAIYESMEEEMHKRKDGTRYYQEDGYKRFLRKAIMERKGIKPESVQQNGIPMSNAFPILSQSANMLEDGTLNITAPAWLGGRQITLNNEMEQHFEENRQKFLQSIYAQGGD